MTNDILMNRLKEFINDYGDVFITDENKNAIKLKDGEGNMFEVQILQSTHCT